MILKRKSEVEQLSDLEFVSELSGLRRRVYPQMMSNVTIGVMPTSQPQRTLFCSKVFV